MKKINKIKTHHRIDFVEVKPNKQLVKKLNYQQEIAQDNLEIERSLYYLGKALYRYTFLQKQKGEL